MCYILVYLNTRFAVKKAKYHFFYLSVGNMVYLSL